MIRARYAADPACSRGRLHPEDGQAPRGPRDAFQRDRDRIIHSVAFRRLRHKTQVFISPDGDHFRVRLTHSLEVAQIARAMARVLGLNEDLTEALALAHDMGHPPFGHAGEDALTAAVADVGGFDHNAHSIRILTRLESAYPRFDGLNLSWETLEGLAKHNGPVLSPTWALAAYDAMHGLDLGSHAGLEAQVAAIADDIAYDSHDLDDGIRSGLIDIEEACAVPMVARGWQAARDRYPDLDADRLLPELIRDQIGRMVNDVLAETGRRLAQAEVETIDDVRAAGRPLVGFSDAMAADEKALKRFHYAHLYHHPQQQAIAAAAHGVIARLAAAYRADPALLPDDWRRRLPEGEPERGRHIADFIAGMTDRFAIRMHERLIGPADLPEGF
jgi:dGTPase